MVFYPSLLPIIGDLGPVPMLTGHLGQEKKNSPRSMAKGKGYLNEEDQKVFPEDGPSLVIEKHLIMVQVL